MGGKNGEVRFFSVRNPRNLNENIVYPVVPTEEGMKAVGTGLSQGVGVILNERLYKIIREISLQRKKNKEMLGF